MRSIALIFSLIVLFTASAAAEELLKGYIKQTAFQAESAGKGNESGLSYLSDNGSLFLYADINLWTADNFTLRLPDNKTYALTAGKPSAWNFQHGYTAKSGTKPLHELQVKLPDCFLGNVCAADKPFSVAIPRLTRRDISAVRFFIEKEDVTTLFYFNEQQQAFKIKEYYEPQFFSRFKGGSAVLVWRTGKNAAFSSVRVNLADKAIKGKIVSVTGKTPLYLTGREIVFSFAGSDTILPHTMKAVIDKKGEYLLENLPTFEYNPVIPPLTDARLEFQSAGTQDNITFLNLLHTVPDYDAVFTADTESYRAGEFTVFSPSAAGFTGNIAEFVQISGDLVPFKVTGNKAALIFPEKRGKTGDVSFSAKIAGKKILFIFPHPIPADDGYEQFSPFSGEGFYAHTRLDGFNNGGVLEYKGKNIPIASLNSFIRSSAGSVKVHLFDPSGKALDITEYFSWNNAAQSLELKSGRFENLYTDLKNSPSTLGVTFCETSGSGRCFRINKIIRPGGASVTVNPGINPGDAFMVLRQLDNPVMPAVRIARASKDGKYRFADIPEGQYQLLLADLSLKYQGSAYMDITPGDNEQQAEISVELRAFVAGADLRKLTSGDLTPLLREPLKLYRNDYKSIDLKTFNISSVDEVSIMGEFPGEYSLHPDLSLMLYTGDNDKDLYSVFTLKNRNGLFTLPVFYNGNEAPVISEEGLDYTMCPKDRPYCSNAFVDIKGVADGVYNGRTTLSLAFPIGFNRQDLRVVMEQVSDITDHFLVNSKYNRITLKRSSIPAFLSYLSANTTPIRIDIKNRRYYLKLTAGYKSAEISVTDRYGAQNSIFSGMELNIACEQGGARIYSGNVAVSSSGFVQLEDLPDCAYHVTLIDRKRFFSGELDMNLRAGQNKKKEILQVNCVSTDDQFINNCVPIIPVMARNRLIAPEAAILFVDGYKEKIEQIRAETAGTSLNSKLLGRAIVFYAAKPAGGKTFQNKIILNEDNISPINITVDSIASYRIRTVARPAGSPLPVLRLTGVNDSFTYLGREFAVTFDLTEKLPADGITVYAVSNEGSDNITGMFFYDSSAKTLTLLPANHGEFAALFGNGRLQLSVHTGEADGSGYYNIELVLALSSADIFMTATGEDASALKSANAVLAGSSGVNGFEYRQESKLSGNKTAVFRQVPFGIYNLTVFDLESDTFGSTEVSVPPEKTDLYLEVEVNRIAQVRE